MILNKDYSELVQNVIDGNTDPLEAYGELMDVKSFIDECVNEVKSIAISEAEKFDDKQFKYKGFTFKRTDGRRTYKFDHIDKWNEYRSSIKEIENLAKSAADKYSKNTTIIDDDGVVVEPAIVTHTSSSLSVRRS